jgi:hypothetical protein
MLTLTAEEDDSLYGPQSDHERPVSLAHGVALRASVARDVAASSGERL